MFEFIKKLFKKEKTLQKIIAEVANDEETVKGWSFIGMPTTGKKIAGIKILPQDMALITFDDGTGYVIHLSRLVIKMTPKNK